MSRTLVTRAPVPPHNDEVASVQTIQRISGVRSFSGELPHVLSVLL